MDLNYKNRMNINTTEYCNLKCRQCNRFCNIMPCDKQISIDEVEKMCQEVSSENDHLEMIQLSGGEPTLHPELGKVIETLQKYNIADTIMLVTNNTKRKIKRNMVKRYNICASKTGRKYRNGKRKEAKHNLPVTLAPIDIGLWGELPLTNCNLPFRSGMGFSRHGYYPCAVSAAIGRIFQIKGIEKWKDVTTESIHALMDKTCRYCGHYLVCIKREPKTCLLPFYPYHEKLISVSWQKALKEYAALPDDQK